MADGTRLGRIDETLQLLHNTLAAQAKRMDDMVSQMAAMGTRLQTMDTRVNGMSQPHFADVGESSENHLRGPAPREGEPDTPNYGRHTCLDFPRFEGADPSGWIYRAEQFLLHQHTPLTQRLLIASYHLGGKALYWFRWMERSNAIASWDDFAKILMIRFGPSPYEDAVASLTKLR